MIGLSEFWRGVVVGLILGIGATWFWVALADIGKNWDLESENLYLRLKLKEVTGKGDIGNE